MWYEGGSNSVVESQPSKLLVAGSIPVSRSSLRSGMQAKAGLAVAAKADSVVFRWAAGLPEMSGPVPM